MCVYDGGNMWPWYCTAELVDTRVIRRNHPDAGHCLRCIAVAMHCDFFYDGMLILSSNGVFKSQYLFPRISFLYSLPTSLAEPTRFAPHWELWLKWLCEFVSQTVSKWMGRICSNALEWMRFSSLGTCELHEFSVENRSIHYSQFSELSWKNLQAIKCCEGWAFHLSDGH